MNESLFELRGKVTETRKQVIPKMHVVTVEAEDGTIIEFDAHEDLVRYTTGEEIEITVTREVPDYREGIDFVGRGTVASIKSEGDRRKILISIGGLLFIIDTRRDINLNPTEKVYVKVAKQ